MQVILTEDVPKLGEMGDLIEVAPGYGRNYLIPKGLAVAASSASAAHIQHKLEQIERKREKEREEAKKLLATLEGVAITIPKRVSDGDSLYGSVTKREIAEVLKASNHHVDHRKIQLDDHITEIGIYDVPVKLASGIFANIRVWVVAM